MTYSEKLKDPRWQKKRLEIMQAAGFACEDCNRKDQELQIHHCAYIRALQPWEYGVDLLMCLCAGCHKHRQDRDEAFRVALGRILRFVKRDNYEQEAWRIIHDVQLRETVRQAAAFNCLEAE